jgi:hypothetical protein
MALEGDRLAPANLMALPLYKVAEIEDVIHHIRILQDDVGEHLGIDQHHGKLLIERVVVPIHFREPDDSGATRPCR